MAYELQYLKLLHTHGHDLDFPKLKPGNECKAISHLVIEVKKSENKPIVFFKDGFSQAHNMPDATFKSDHDRFHGIPFKGMEGFGTYGNVYGEEESFESFGVAHRYIDLPLHRAFYTAFASNQPSAIYEATKQSLKALEYLKLRYETGGKVLHIFVPVIVIDGEIWSASLNEDGEMSIVSKDHLLLRQNQLVEHEPGSQYEEERVYDVVTRTGFPAFLTQLQADHLSLYRAWTDYHHALEKKKLKKKTKKKKTKKKPAKSARR